MVLLGLVTCACAQSYVGGKKSAASGQTSVDIKYSGRTLIYVVFPPTASGSNRDNHFGPSVMTQSAIDGVTIRASWAAVETTTPSATPCSPVGTDVCQLDSSGWYHIFDWSTVDSDMAYYFNAGNTHLFGAKKVNVLLFGESLNGSGANDSTPYYVTTSSWISHAGGGPQDVLNHQQNGGTCSNLAFSGYTVSTINSDFGGLVTVTFTTGSGIVTGTNGNGFVAGDTVWVDNASVAHLNTGAAGLPIHTVGTDQFTYQSSPNCSNCLGMAGLGNVNTQVTSWLVPYETPMKVARKTFIAAGLQHFGPNFTQGTTIIPSQVGYVRAGKSVGGESFVYCTGALSGFTTGTWKTYITDMTDFETSQRAAAQVLQPLNVVNGDYASYPDYEAQDAVAHANGYGFVDGFGSQGLSLKDSLVSPCASDWCSMFSTYNRANSLELQQIANSDPTDEDCGGPPSYTKCTPTGDAGDLTVWLPFAAQHGMNVLELYTVDAELAFDPCFCDLNGTACGSTNNAGCTHGSFTSLNGWTAAQQYNFFQSVGLGYTGCSPASGQTQTTAGGSCSYRDMINKWHGYN